MEIKHLILGLGVLFIVLAILWTVPDKAVAHCDTLDGPVVVTARAALEKGDITPVLKWVGEEHEEEIVAAFQRTLAVRGLSPGAQALADMYFFETLVRIHRAGEGAPYDGLKSVGSVDPAIAKADESLKTGSADELANAIAGKIVEGIKSRFELALKAMEHADESVEAGREFVEAYVEYVHYVERIHQEATATSGHHGKAEKSGEENHHH